MRGAGRVEEAAVCGGKGSMGARVGAGGGGQEEFRVAKGRGEGRVHGAIFDGRRGWRVVGDVAVLIDLPGTGSLVAVARSWCQ